MTKEQIKGVYAIRHLANEYANLSENDWQSDYTRDRRAELCSEMTNALVEALGISESVAVRMVLLEFDNLYKIVNP